MSRPTAWLISALALAGLFLAFPGLDLLAAGLFHDPLRGFAGRGVPLLEWLHDQVGVLAWSACLALLAGLALASRSARAATWLPRRRVMAYLALVLLLGPGLTVNVLFKDQWGRARPSQVTEFGGDGRFTPAWVVSDQCHHNCSFVCGDASVGFSLLAGAFLARRRRWFVLGLLAGGGLGLMRMAQGGHFLSDVVFSFYAVLAVAWLLHRLLFPARREPRPALAPAA